MYTCQGFGLKEGYRIAFTLVLAAISIACSVMLVNFPEVPENEGWLIRQHDQVQYYVETELHAGDTYVADLLSDYGITSNSYFWIRAAETPSSLNITNIVENIANLQGVVPVEQQIGQNWVLRNSSLPFFLPTGYWDEIDELLNPHGMFLKKEWWGEISLTTIINDVELGIFGLVIAWELSDGVLQGMTINATSHSGWDFVRLALSSQRLAYQTDLDYILRIAGRNIPFLLLFFGAFGPIVVILFIWRKGIENAVKKPLSGSLEDRLEEYGRDYLLFWSLGLAIVFVAGFIASQNMMESILPVIVSWCLGLFLASAISIYKIRNIQWGALPVELVQYTFVNVAASVAGMFVFTPGEVSSPIAYALPLAIIIAAFAILIVMYPLSDRALGITQKNAH